MKTIEKHTVPVQARDARVIVTEQEVMLGSAAALVVPPRGPRRRRAAIAGWFVALWPEPRPHPMPRYDFTEHSRMAREMGRL